MHSRQLAAQLYTIRDHAQDLAGLRRSLRRIREIGYTAVQVSGIVALPETELAQLLADEGLTCCATHEPGDRILDDPAAIVARLHALGCKLTAYPYPKGIDFQSPGVVESFTARLETSATFLARAGCQLGYHNHDIEFLPFRGRPILDYIFSNTRELVAELDTYWVQAGGGDPATWCERMKGRLPFLHLKDYALSAPGKPIFAEVGSGNLDWHRIIPAAERSGCQWFIVERDSGELDPFESLRRSYDTLHANFVRAG